MKDLSLEKSDPLGKGIKAFFLVPKGRLSYDQLILLGKEEHTATAHSLQLKKADCSPVTFRYVILGT